IKAPNTPTTSPTAGMTRNQRSETDSSDLAWSPRGRSCWVTPRLKPSCACQSTMAPANQLISPPSVAPAHKPKTNPVIAPAKVAARRLSGGAHRAIRAKETEVLHGEPGPLSPVVVEGPPHGGAHEAILLDVESR